MSVYIFHGANGWYWRGDRVNACGPFPTAAQATADALKLDVPADEFFGGADYEMKGQRNAIGY